MKCMSCEEEISTKWKYAIEQNNCPFCGKEIMDSKLQENLVSLKAILDELQTYQDQLNDWLRGNYNYIKADSVPSSLVNKRNKVVVNDDQDESVLDTQPAEITQAFFHNAGAMNTLKNQAKIKQRMLEEKAKNGNQSSAAKIVAQIQSESEDGEYVEATLPEDPYDVSNDEDDIDIDEDDDMINIATQMGHGSNTLQKDKASLKKMDPKYARAKMNSGKGRFTRAT